MNLESSSRDSIGLNGRTSHHAVWAGSKVGAAPKPVQLAILAGQHLTPEMQGLSLARIVVVRQFTKVTQHAISRGSGRIARAGFEMFAL